MTPLVLVTTMNVKLIVPIKSLLAKSTVWVSFESALVNSSWIIVAKFFVFPKLLRGEQLVLVHKDFFVLGAEVAHELVVHAPYMALEVCQVPTNDIAATVGAVKSEEKNGIIEDVPLFIFDALDVIHLLKVFVRKIFVALVGVICEDDVLGFSL